MKVEIEALFFKQALLMFGEIGLIKFCAVSKV